MHAIDRWAPGVWRRPYLLLTLVALGWGANAVAGRLAVGHVSPMVIVCLRWLIVMAVVAGLSGRSLLAEWPGLLPHWRFLFVLGALGYTVFNAVFYWAAHHTSAVNMGVLQGGTPVLIMAGSFLAYRTRIGALQVAGLLATLAGVAVTASRGDWQVLRDLAFNVGDVGIVAASVLYAGYAVALRTRPAVAPLTFFAAIAFSAFVTSLPLLAFEVATDTALWPRDAFGWSLIVFISLVPSLLSQLLFMRGVELIGPGRAGLFMNLVPVVAALMGVAILGETFAPYHAVGLTLVLGGIWLAERRRPGA